MTTRAFRRHGEHYVSSRRRDDHRGAGHDRLHGTRHRDDYRLAPIVATDGPCDVARPSDTFHITALRGLVQELLPPHRTAGRCRER
jgi:hypothetical protein